MKEINMHEDNNGITKDMLDFIHKSPTAFHAVSNIKTMLEESGAKELRETDSWKIEKGRSYYVSRNDSSVIAFTVPEKTAEGLRIIAAHTDSPVFKIKSKPEIEAEKSYVKLNVEKYGGSILNSWFDRPLSVAGRLIVNENGKLEKRLIDIDRDLLMIPSLAIHMDRSANEGKAINVQDEMLPLFAACKEDKKADLLADIAVHEGIVKEDIKGFDLFVYNRMAPTFYGENNEFIASPRLDDLECAYTALRGYLKCVSERNDSDMIPVYCAFDNEEVGSMTKQGADSTFLYDVIIRLNEALGSNAEGFRKLLAKSFMVSADNAHAAHPNYPGKADPVNRPVMNKGIVLKYSANQKYTTDAVSEAFFVTVCERAGVPFQRYFNRSNIVGGSTLGNISATHISIDTCDIGLAQLSMHSSYETAGSEDPAYLVSFAAEFFRTEDIIVR